MRPIACAPYGYYGDPSWFAGGLFIGAGPWFRGGWGGYGTDTAIAAAMVDGAVIAESMATVAATADMAIAAADTDGTATVAVMPAAIVVDNTGGFANRGGNHGNGFHATPGGERTLV